MRAYTRRGDINFNIWQNNCCVIEQTTLAQVTFNTIGETVNVVYSANNASPFAAAASNVHLFVKVRMHAGDVSFARI